MRLIECPEIQIIRTEILLSLALRPIYLSMLQRWLHSCDNACGNLVLEIEHVIEATRERLAPKMRSGPRIGHLCGNSHAIGCLAYAAFDDIANREIPANAADIHGLVLKGECRVARNNSQPTHTCQASRQFLNDTVGEIVLLRIGRHVGERKNCNARLTR
jgi:hypothetical protein